MYYKGPTFSELMRQCLSSTERGYDLLASKFDYTPFLTPDTILRVVQQHLRQYVPISAALDICCGTGAGMRILRPLCRDRVVGIDFSQGMIKVARKKTEVTKGDAEIKFVHGNVLNMSFDAEFDLAVCFGAFGHILTKNESRFIDQVASVLKPGGRFVFVTSYRPLVWSRRFWFCHIFNVVMKLRNMVKYPSFIMYYLTFLLPKVKTLLENHGFDVEVEKVFEGELSYLRLVIATRRSSG